MTESITRASCCRKRACFTSANKKRIENKLKANGGTLFLG
ncbi:hypothetical protein O9929_12145 [Vibrio lentus]|nr:hypothetical protein [Vibrio lentus]